MMAGVFSESRVLEMIVTTLDKSVRRSCRIFRPVPNIYMMPEC